VVTKKKAPSEEIEATVERHVQRALTAREKAKAEREGRRTCNVSVHKFGGEAAVFAALSCGVTLKEMSARLDVTEDAFWGWIRSNEDRHAAFARAREAAAHLLAEQTLDIADTATPQDAQVAKLRTDTRRWLASKWNQGVYGDKAATTVNVNVTDLHLQALRKAPQVLDVTDVEPKEEG
jgi:hypothetical protein